MVSARNLLTIWLVRRSTAFFLTSKMFWLKIYYLDILGSFWWPLLPLRWLRVYRYVVKLQNILDFQDQVFIFCDFLCLSFGKDMGQGACWIYYKCCFILSIDEHCIRSVEIYHFVTLWQSVGEILLPVGCVPWDMRIHIAMSTQHMCSIVSPTLSNFLRLLITSTPKQCFS